MTVSPSAIDPNTDPKSIWKNQERESASMSVPEIREKVQNLKAKTRRHFALGLTGAFIITAFFIHGFFRYVHDTYSRISWVVMIASCFYMTFCLAYENIRTMRSERMGSDTGVSNCLRFYRRTLEQKRSHARHMALAAVPMVAGGIMNFLPAVAITYRYPDGNRWVHLLPFVLILGSWFALYGVQRRRMRRDLRREFTLLELLEKKFPE